MRYSLGQNLADFGFGFFEKLHAPILLIHRLGRVSRINEAGRKFLKIAHITQEQLEKFVRSQTSAQLQFAPQRCRRIRLPASNAQLIVQSLKDSDYLLVEIHH